MSTEKRRGYGNTVNDDTYQKLYQAWKRTKSIRASALEAGVSAPTASKYINSIVLSDGRPGIKAALQQRHSEEIAKIDNDLYKVNNLTKALIAQGFSELLNVLNSVRLNVTGERMPDGSIMVSENTYRRLLHLAVYASDRLEAITEKRKRDMMLEFPEGIPDEDEPLTTSVESIPTNQIQSKAVEIINRFEKAIYSDPNERAEKERKLIQTLTKATLHSGGRTAEQSTDSRKPGDDSEEEEPLIASNN